MSVLNAFLVLATLVSFVADAVAIVKGKRRLGIVLLATAGILVVALLVMARHTAAVEAENRALTDTQARAQRLLDAWESPDGAFNASENVSGTNEGIAAAAADLMEDVRACRPGAHEEARVRLERARHRADEFPGDDLGDDFAREDIWQDAARAAYRQVQGVAEVAPNC